MVQISSLFYLSAAPWGPETPVAPDYLRQLYQHCVGLYLHEITKMRREEPLNLGLNSNAARFPATDFVPL